MRISDWSSDVCSSDLRSAGGEEQRNAQQESEGKRAGGCAHHGRLPNISFLIDAILIALNPCAKQKRSYIRLRNGLSPARTAGRVRQLRSEERRVGKACVRTCSTRWSPEQ